MKRHFNRYLSLLLLLALLFAASAAPRAAWAGEADPGEAAFSDAEFYDGDFDEAVYMEYAEDWDIPGEEIPLFADEWIDPENAAEGAAVDEPVFGDEPVVEAEPEFRDEAVTEDEPVFIERRGTAAPRKAEAAPETNVETNAETETEDGESGIQIYAKLNESGNLDFFLRSENDEKLAENIQAHEVTGDLPIAGQTCSIRDYLKKCVGDKEIEKPANAAGYIGGIDGVQDYHATVELGGDTAIRLYFRAAGVESLTFTCKDKALALEGGDGLWFVTVPGVSVAELPADFTIVGSRGEQTVTIRFSAFCYAAQHWDDTEESEIYPFVLLCKALAAAMAS